MAIVLRYFHHDGLVWKHFFDVVDVNDYWVSTLNRVISNVLAY